MNTKRNKLVFYAPLLTAIVTLGLFFLALFNGWMGEWKHVGAEFCEASRPGLIKQPVNTWSNFGFIFTGLYIGWLLMQGVYSQNKNALTQKTFYAAFFASLVVYLGPASMAMHATETEIGGNLDMLSMYLVAAFLTAYSLERFFRLRPLYFTIIFVVVVVTCVYVQDLPYRMPLVGYFGNFIFGVFLTTTIIFEALNSFVRKMDHDLKWGVFSLLAMLLAFLIWNFSLNNSSFCNPYGLIQGHGIWHLLNAVSLYCLFRYYVSEHTE